MLAIRLRVANRQFLNMEPIGIEMAEFFKFRCRQHWRAEFNFARILWIICGNVSVWADEDFCADHQLFTDRIDRWVGHLGKLLFEISEQALRLFGQNG